jgi:hypothetical protein
MFAMAPDKRARKRQIPAVAMPDPVARYFHHQLIRAADRLEEAAQKPATASGAVDQLVILEQLLADLLELRALLTAWTVEDNMGEAPMTEVGRRIGRSVPTISRRYSEGHVQALRDLD